jgi:hypothetical protein
MVMFHSGSPSLHTILEEFVDEGDTTSSGGGGRGRKLRLPHLSRMQHGEPDCPHHNHATIGGHSSTSKHLDGPAANYRTTTRHRAPS